VWYRCKLHVNAMPASDVTIISKHANLHRYQSLFYQKPRTTLSSPSRSSTLFLWTHHELTLPLQEIWQLWDYDILYADDLVYPSMAVVFPELPLCDVWSFRGFQNIVWKSKLYEISNILSLMQWVIYFVMKGVIELYEYFHFVSCRQKMSYQI